MMKQRWLLLVALTALCALPLRAQDSGADLAQDLTNPLASLITLPIQLNDDALTSEPSRGQSNAER
jgi:hypothetical protein